MIYLQWFIIATRTGKKKLTMTTIFGAETASALKMETVCFSETLTSTDELTRRQNPEQHRNPPAVKTSNLTWLPCRITLNKMLPQILRDWRVVSHWTKCYLRSHMNAVSYHTEQNVTSDLTWLPCCITLNKMLPQISRDCRVVSYWTKCYLRSHMTAVLYRTEQNVTSDLTWLPCCIALNKMLPQISRDCRVVSHWTKCYLGSHMTAVLYRTEQNVTSVKGLWRHNISDPYDKWR
jgi:hypothetical protein